jgi:hypothetical protein
MTEKEMLTNPQPSRASAKIEGLEIWRLCRQYTVAQAALLVAGHDPSVAVQVEKLRPEERPAGYEAARHALEQALTRDPDMGWLVHVDRTKEHPGRHDPIDVERSVIFASNLKTWLSSRGVDFGFFFDAKDIATANVLPDFLNPVIRGTRESSPQRCGLGKHMTINRQQTEDLRNRLLQPG